MRNYDLDFELVTGATASSDAYVELVRVLNALGDKLADSPLFGLLDNVYVFDKERIWALPTMGHRIKEEEGESNVWMTHYWIAFGGLDNGETAQDHFFEINPPWFKGSAPSYGLFLRAANRLYLARRYVKRAEWANLDNVERLVDGQPQTLSFLAEISEDSDLLVNLARLFRDRRKLRIEAGKRN